ncbi:CHAT domain-containing protein [Gilvibacter sediminis]|uniref:CHAT domain-containing protein n=1 Tax=Gilvibacter sediminis TaxID=379071 RepID=UPI002350837A|nr:CHAT domain-containing protein [Gilvibacter sediminis]MDC7996673.1 CHAT domain-containing protein [Gilvibacter sediminis]
MSVLICGMLNGQTLFESYEAGIAKVPLEQRQTWVDSLLTLAVASTDLQQAIQIAHQESRYYNNKARDLSTAIAYSQRELAWYDELQLYNKDYNQALYNTARFCYWDKRWPAARAFFQKLIDKKIDSLKVARAHFYLGNISEKQGDPYAAVDAYLQGRLIYKAKGRMRGWVSRSLDLAQIYEEINSPESLKKKFELLQEIDQALDNGASISARNAVILKLHYASYYNNANYFDYESSKAYYLKSIDDLLAVKDTSLLVRSYVNLANLYAQNHSDSALYYIDRAKNYPGSASTITRLLNIECDFYLENDRLNDALAAIHQSLEENTQDTFALDQVPSAETMDGAIDAKLLLWGLTKKADIYTQQYRINKEKTYLDLAMIQLKAADYIADQLFVGNRDDASKLFWRKYAYKIYGNGTFVAWELNQPDQAFYFAEKKQAVLLTQNTSFNKQLEQLPDSLVKAYYYYNKQINKAQLAALADPSLEHAKLLDLKADRTAFLKQLSISYPELKGAIAQIEIESLENVLSELESNTAILHYLWNDSEKPDQSHQVLLISEANTILISLPQAKELSKQVSAFSEFVMKPFQSKSDATNFHTLSANLYKRLFPEELQNYLKDITNLIIVADQNLNAVPFEALVSQSSPLTYLIEQKNISYAQSLSYLHKSKEMQRNTQHDLLAMAPVRFQQEGLVDLPATTDEIAAASLYYEGMIFSDIQASRKHFLQNASEARIIHLATHAAANELPWISMQDSLINLVDLNGLRLKADLVVLSACNTATGQALKGEGVASLARGFFQSGARTVISSRWSTNDKTTQSILTSFYAHLESGVPSATALRLAKMDYLKQADLSEKSPYYWSSLILIGDSVPIQARKKWNYAWFSILLVVPLYFLRKKFKNRG